MPIIHIRTEISAPIGVCFDLARDIDLHIRSTPGTSERAVAGVTTGLIGLGEEVTWEAVHFGVRQRLTSRITQFERPSKFRDCMTKGIFASLQHDHVFESRGSSTVMVDIFDYRSPLGLLGRLADIFFLERYLRRLLVTRANIIKTEAETIGKLNESSLRGDL